MGIHTSLTCKNVEIFVKLSKEVLAKISASVFPNLEKSLDYEIEIFHFTNFVLTLKIGT